MLRCIVVGGFLCACSFDPGGFTSSGDGGVSPTFDGALSADADPNAPDSDPSAPDAEPPAIDAEPPPPDAMPPPPDAAPVLRTLVFRDGLGGYSGTRDTTLRESEPFTVHGSDGTIRWDMVSGASPEGQDYGLLRFEGITGVGGDAIPTGATIVSATLSLVVVNAGAAPGGLLHEVDVDWTELATWDTFGLFPGVQSDEIGAFVDNLPTGMGSTTVDVTSAIETWVTDPLGLTNRGWIFVPDNGDGVEVVSRESDVPEQRPTLTVEFFDP